MNIKKIVKYAIVLPIAIVWDLWLLIVKALYDGTMYVDKRGSSFLDKHFNF